MHNANQHEQNLVVMSHDVFFNYFFAFLLCVYGYSWFFLLLISSFVAIKQGQPLYAIRL